MNHADITHSKPNANTYPIHKTVRQYNNENDAREYKKTKLEKRTRNSFFAFHPHISLQTVLSWNEFKYRLERIYSRSNKKKQQRNRTKIDDKRINDRSWNMHENPIIWHNLHVASRIGVGNLFQIFKLSMKFGSCKKPQKALQKFVQIFNGKP